MKWISKVYLVLPILFLSAEDSIASDFAARCANPNVVRCFDFDSASEAEPHIVQGQQPSVVPCEGNKCAQIVSNEKASGTGSLRFEIPSQAPPDSSGDFSINFTPGVLNYSNGPFPIQFGEGEEFYVQWRQRFSPEMLRKFQTDYGHGGFKSIILGEGDRPYKRAYACTELEVVITNAYQYGVPQMYHTCGIYEQLMGYSAETKWTIQNKAPCRWRNGSPDPNDGECIPYVANEWMTFQMHVKVGTYNSINAPFVKDTTHELWVARENQPSKLAISHSTSYTVSQDADAKYGKVWLLPFQTGKDPDEVHPTAYVWYDDLIISKAKIPDPGFANGNQPPAIPSNITILKK